MFIKSMRQQMLRLSPTFCHVLLLAAMIPTWLLIPIILVLIQEVGLATAIIQGMTQGDEEIMEPVFRNWVGHGEALSTLLKCIMAVVVISLASTFVLLITIPSKAQRVRAKVQVPAEA